MAPSEILTADAPVGVDMAWSLCTEGIIKGEGAATRCEMMQQYL